MATWVPAPPVGDFAAIIEGTLLPPGSLVYNSAPLFVPAPSFTVLINNTTVTSSSS